MTDPTSQLAAEGQHDSSGKFSLDLLAAHRKLSKLSQAQPGLMLGKLVQAAVAGQARALDFTIGSSQITARLHFDREAANQELVQKHVALAVASHLSWQGGGQECCLLTSAPDQLLAHYWQG